MQALPDPARDIFAGRILQSFDIVEIVMVQLLVDGAIGIADVGEIHDPAAALTDIALYRYLDGEGMSVQPGELMLRWDIGQTVRRLETELFGYLHN